MKSLSFLGLGLMGISMSRNLLAAGINLTLWNRSTEKAVKLADENNHAHPNAIVTVASSAKEAILANPICCLMLFDLKSIHDVLDCFKAGELDNRMIVNFTTISPENSKSIAEIVREKGGILIECPVLGNPIAAAARELKLLIGTQTDTISEEMNVLAKALGTAIKVNGPYGTPSAMKLALNNLIFAHLTAFSLSHSIVQQYSVPREVFMDVVTGPLLNFKYYPIWDKKFTEHRYEEATFSIEGAVKDATLIKETAEAAGIATNVVDGELELLRQAMEAGYQGKDMSSVYEKFTKK